LSADISDNSKKNKSKNNKNKNKKNKNKKNKNKNKRGTQYRWITTDQAKKDKERNLAGCLSTTLGEVFSWYFVFPCRYNCTM